MASRCVSTVRDPALDHLRRADPVMDWLIEADPAFDPQLWRQDLPPLHVFGAVLFQVKGQRLSVPSTRAILRRVQAFFGGRLPTPSEFWQPATSSGQPMALNTREQSSEQ